MNGWLISQHGPDAVFVFAGDGDGLTADGERLGRGQGGIGKIHQIGAVHAEETLAQQVFPLADAVPVPVVLTVAGDNPNLGIVGLHVEDFPFAQRDFPVVRGEGDGPLGGIFLLQPLDQEIVPIGQDGQDGGHEHGIAQHGGEVPARPALLLDHNHDEPFPQEDHQEGHQHHAQDNIDGIQDALQCLGIPFHAGEEERQGHGRRKERHTHQNGLAPVIIQACEQKGGQKDGGQPVGDYEDDFLHSGYKP